MKVLVIGHVLAPHIVIFQREEVLCMTFSQLPGHETQVSDHYTDDV